MARCARHLDGEPRAHPSARGDVARMDLRYRAAAPVGPKAPNTCRPLLVAAFLDRALGFACRKGLHLVLRASRSRSTRHAHDIGARCQNWPAFTYVWPSLGKAPPAFSRPRCLIPPHYARSKSRASRSRHAGRARQRPLITCSNTPSLANTKRRGLGAGEWYIGRRSQFASRNQRHLCRLSYHVCESAKPAPASCREKASGVGSGTDRFD